MSVAHGNSLCYLFYLFTLSTHSRLCSCTKYIGCFFCRKNWFYSLMSSSTWYSLHLWTFFRSRPSNKCVNSLKSSPNVYRSFPIFPPLLPPLSRQWSWNWNKCPAIISWVSLYPRRAAEWREYLVTMLLYDVATDARDTGLRLQHRRQSPTKP